jgi:hypothetical protein
MSQCVFVPFYGAQGRLCRRGNGDRARVYLKNELVFHLFFSILALCLLSSHSAIL